MSNANRTTPFTRLEATIHAAASARIEGVTLDDETRVMMGKWAEEKMSPDDLNEWINDQPRNW